MKEHFSNLPDYLYRAARKVTFYIGIAAGIVFVVIAIFASISEATASAATLLIVTVSLVLSGYGVYREERVMRAERERAVKVTAKVGSWASNIPDPGRDKVSLSVHVFWEVWVSREVISTDRLALNLIHAYDKPWWQFWKKTRFPQSGIPRKGHDTTQYRVKIDPNDNQPFKDDATFEYIGKAVEAHPHWLLELVLITGMPIREHRIPVFIDYDEMRSRGTNPPL